MLHGKISQRRAPSSPSITMEDGSYQIQYSQLGSPSKHRSSHSQVKAGQLSLYERRVSAMIVLLVLAIAFCFGSAYYLFSTGWVTHSVPHSTSTSDLDNSSSVVSAPLPIQVVEFERDLGNAPIDGSTKYLSYLPHSGFHNQRIALENALIMARMLNRTLLVPPVRLGKGILTYYPFDHLYEIVALSGKDGLNHCADSTTWKTLPIECTDYYDYTFVPWNWLSNITDITNAQPIFQRWNMSDAWLVDHLGIPPNETFSIKDSQPYQYRFVDTDPLDMPSSRYDEVISMSLLAHLSHRLIQIGTLFGSSRLRLRRSQNLDHRTLVRQSMTFTNDLLLGIAESIKRKMGGHYIAAHIRIGDGVFARKAAKNTRSIWWRLVRDVSNMNEERIVNLERTLTNSSSSPPIMPLQPHALRISGPSLHPLPSTILPRLLCRRPRHQELQYAALNVPLFISTDVQDPASHPLLRRFFDTFPCTFFLPDFGDEVAELNKLKSGYDGLALGDSMVPFLDAVVAGKAHQVVGTEGSTFSQFVQDILWRQYNGMEIVQRG